MALRPTKSTHVRSLGVILPPTYPTERAHKNFGVERIRTHQKSSLRDGADRRPSSGWGGGADAHADGDAPKLSLGVEWMPHTDRYQSCLLERASTCERGGGYEDGGVIEMGTSQCQLLAETRTSD